MYVAHSTSGEIMSKRFLQKFLYYAKHRPWQPVLTPAAEGYIAEQYSQWRVDKVYCVSYVSKLITVFHIHAFRRLETLALGGHCPSLHGHLRR